MADTSAATGLTVQQWDDKAYREYLGWNKFNRYLGMSPNMPIQVKESLTTKKGDKITFSLINRLTNSAVTGSSTLEGNEEAMDSRSFAVTVAQRRNAVRVSESEEQFSAIGLRQAMGPGLRDWAMEDMRDRVVAALASINGVAYGTATEAQKDAWLDDNTDRVIFGDAVGNLDQTAPAGGATNDHSGSLGAITAAMTLDSGLIDLVVRRAKTASPRIKPVRVNEAGDEEWFILLCQSLAFRDLQADTAIQQADREARARGLDNPLFTGGDLLYRGVIIREIEQIDVLSGVGNGAIDVAPNYLIGAQAVAMGVARRISTVSEVFDYGDKQGLAIRYMDAIEKMSFGSGSSDTDDLKDHGVHTVFTAGVADA